MMDQAVKDIESIINNSKDNVVILNLEQNFPTGYLEKVYHPQIIELSSLDISLDKIIQTFINPFDINLNNGFIDMKIDMKIDLLISLCDIISNGLTNYQCSLIPKLVKHLYEPVLNSRDSQTGKYDYSLTPTLKDFWFLLREQSGADAYLLSTFLEIWVHGSLDFFANKTTLQHENRFVIYDLTHYDLKLRTAASLVIMDYIMQQSMDENNLDKYTWIYLNDDQSLLEIDNPFISNFKHGNVQKCLNGTLIPVSQRLTEQLAEAALSDDMVLDGEILEEKSECLNKELKQLLLSQRKQSAACIEYLKNSIERDRNISLGDLSFTNEFDQACQFKRELLTLIPDLNEVLLIPEIDAIIDFIYQKTYDDLRKKGLLNNQRWRKVSEELPKLNQEVLVYHDGNYALSSIFDYDINLDSLTKEPIWEYTGLGIDTPPWWHTLPEPPDRN